VWSGCRSIGVLAVILTACHACASADRGSEPATLTAISVTPVSVNLGQTLSRQLTATASYSDGTSQGKTAQAGWSSTAPGVATVAAGLVTGVSVGTAEIIAALGGFADTSEITVTSTLPALSGVVVTPPAKTIGIGGSTSLVATANYNDGSTAIVTAQATWSSTATGVATVTAGVVSGVAVGTADIIAAYGGFNGTSQITVSSAPPSSYPLVVGPNSRYLVDQNGNPFLLVGDAAWSLIAQLSDQDADTYLTSRQQHGFNLVMVNLIEHKFATNAPADIYNLSPFSGTAFQSTPNEAYFAHADHIIQSAAAKGTIVLLAPAYLGYGCGDEGWCNEIEAASNQDMTNWGTYIGNRYKNLDNIVWLIGGDTDPPPTAKSRLQAMVAAIQAADGRHLFTAHNSSEGMAIDQWMTGAPWLTVNNVYSYSATLYQRTLAAYHVAPAKPYFLIETAYEGDGHNFSQQELRAQSYWTVLSGGFGHVFGNCPVWHFSSPAGAADYCSGNWQDELDSQGTRNMQYLQKLFTARHWQTLVPDEAHSVITGVGTFGSTDYVTAAQASDGSSIIAYLPSMRTVTVNGSGLSGSAMSAWWYDPSSGVSVSAGVALPTNTPKDFTPPGSGDWVLVVDSDAFGFPAP